MGRPFRSILKFSRFSGVFDDKISPNTAFTGLLWLPSSPLSLQAQDPGSTDPFWWPYDLFPTGYDRFSPIRPIRRRRPFDVLSFLKILAVSASLKPVQAGSCGFVVPRLIQLVGASLEPILNCRPVSHCIVGRFFTRNLLALVTVGGAFGSLFVSFIPDSTFQTSLFTSVAVEIFSGHYILLSVSTSVVLSVIYEAPTCYHADIQCFYLPSSSDFLEQIHFLCLDPP